ncbi:hypothetical protein [Paenibacillus ginsengarvi]|uniref:Uncharacterized protein n=1 Tax=Paenibacillus ginsengarvi TaxID=400777 RepID=A0A3B0BUG7_9BACL|nr:hypothetical protein [Paenibacillus ginsengarvi]RKN75859.1 hypothetical protein D7M11_25480 [Paenibacillus ginsengarvi]
MMAFPAWIQQAIQRRLDHVAAQLESDPGLSRYRKEESTAYQAMVVGICNMPNPPFLEWVDKAPLTRAMEHEGMYLQGLRDGVRLVVGLLTDTLRVDESLPVPKKSAAVESGKL